MQNQKLINSKLKTNDGSLSIFTRSFSLQVPQTSNLMQDTSNKSSLLSIQPQLTLDLLILFSPFMVPPFCVCITLVQTILGIARSINLHQHFYRLLTNQSTRELRQNFKYSPRLLTLESQFVQAVLIISYVCPQNAHSQVKVVVSLRTSPTFQLQPSEPKFWEFSLTLLSSKMSPPSLVSYFKLPNYNRFINRHMLIHEIFQGLTNNAHRLAYINISKPKIIQVFLKSCTIN